MIKSLFIKNFTLIDSLSLEFDPKLNVITGETGSGKSIIIEAIDIALGERASKDVIKTGEEKAFIEVVLDINDEEILNFIKNNGIDLDFENEIFISREITQTTTKTRVNGVMVTQNLMQELRELIFDIHSQNQTYKYLNPKTHINLLDDYGNYAHLSLLANYKSNYSKLLKLKSDFEKKVSFLNSAKGEISLLKHQIEEIEKANITDINEYDELKKKREIIVNTEALKELSYSSYYNLYSREDSIISTLNNIENNLTKASGMDERMSSLAETIANSTIGIREVANELRDYSEKLEYDAALLSEIEERLNILDRLRRKYGPTLKDILKSYDEFSEKLSYMDVSDEQLIATEREIKYIESHTDKLASEISVNRHQLAEILSDLIKKEINKLEMPRAEFKAVIRNLEAKSGTGIDEVEFLITTNPGEPLKPLSKVASGGEVSRVMLAIKSIFAKSDKINTVIFDEIDTGISGKASQSVGEALVKLSLNHQIVCITHQPIIAAMADKHFYVEKIQTDETTSVKVAPLNTEDRINVLSYLASGRLDIDGKIFATKLLEQANEIKLDIEAAENAKNAEHNEDSDEDE